jgi:hypothetical protein
MSNAKTFQYQTVAYRVESIAAAARYAFVNEATNHVVGWAQRNGTEYKTGPVGSATLIRHLIDAALGQGAIPASWGSGKKVH